MDKKKTLSQATQEFLRHCEAKGLRKSTCYTYSRVLHALVDAVGDIPVASLTHEHLDRLFAKHNWAPSSRNSRVGQLKGFFSWCRARGYMQRDTDPAFGWRNVRVPKQERQRIPVQEWSRLFDAVRHQQERITLATGLFLFLRGSEQKLIQLKHVHLSTGEIEIYRVKTGDYDVMPISAELHGYLAEHLTYMAEHGWTDPEHYLIGMRVDIGRNQYTNQWVEGSGVLDHTRSFSSPHVVVQRVLKRAGYPYFKEGQHTLRRSGARAYFDSMVNQGYDGALRRVQSMLGHSAAHMTERYLGLDLDRQQRNSDLRGKPMFPLLQDENIVQMVRKANNG